MRKKNKKPLKRKLAKGKKSHARRRFKQRYGKEISTPQMQALVELAEQDKCRSRIADSNGNFRVVLRVGAEVFRFIYNQETRQILTFLPNKQRKRKP